MLDFATCTFVPYSIWSYSSFYASFMCRFPSGSPQNNFMPEKSCESLLRSVLLLAVWLMTFIDTRTIYNHYDLLSCCRAVQQSYSIIHKPLVHIIVFALIPDEFCNLGNDAGNLKTQVWSRCPIASVRVLNASNCTSWKIFAYARFCTHRRMISAGSLRQHVGNIKIPLWDLTFPTWLLPYFDA